MSKVAQFCNPSHPGFILAIHAGRHYRHDFDAEIKHWNKIAAEFGLKGAHVKGEFKPLSPRDKDYGNYDIYLSTQLDDLLEAEGHENPQASRKAKRLHAFVIINGAYQFVDTDNDYDKLQDKVDRHNEQLWGMAIVQKWFVVSREDYESIRRREDYATRNPEWWITEYEKPGARKGGKEKSRLTIIRGDDDRIRREAEKQNEKAGYERFSVLGFGSEHYDPRKKNPKRDISPIKLYLPIPGTFDNHPLPAKMRTAVYLRYEDMPLDANNQVAYFYDKQDRKLGELPIYWGGSGIYWRRKERNGTPQTKIELDRISPTHVRIVRRSVNTNKIVGVILDLKATKHDKVAYHRMIERFENEVEGAWKEAKRLFKEGHL